MKFLFSIPLTLFVINCFSQKTISGIIKNKKNEPIEAAVIKVQNTNAISITKANGAFYINADSANILISAVSYIDTIIAINKLQSPAVIILEATQNILKEVTVSTSKQAQNINVAHEQILQDIFSDYMRTQYSFAGENGIEPFNGTHGLPTDDQTKYLTEHSMQSVYKGQAFPEFHMKEDTKGSIYFFTQWVKGAVYDTTGNLISDSSFYFNYNKITGDLVATRNFKDALYVSKETIAAFALSETDTSFKVFAIIPAISNKFFCEVVVMSDKYDVFKLTTTKFVKSNYHSDGIATTGNNYDEYIDEQQYFLIDISEQSIAKFDLKRKTIKQLFDKLPNTDNYFAVHKNEAINDSFLKSLISSISNR